MFYFLDNFTGKHLFQEAQSIPQPNSNFFVKKVQLWILGKEQGTGKIS